MAWSERSDEGAERTQRQTQGPDEAGGYGGRAPIKKRHSPHKKQLLFCEGCDTIYMYAADCVPLCKVGI